MLEVDHSYMQDEHALEGWMFSNYIALHWYYKIYQRLVKTGLISQYSAMDILDFLQEILKIKIDGYWYLKEATAKTSKALKKLGLNLQLLLQTRERNRDTRGFSAYITCHIGSYRLSNAIIGTVLKSSDFV